MAECVAHSALRSERERGSLHDQWQGADHGEDVLGHLFVDGDQANRVTTRGGTTQMEGGDVDAGAGQCGAEAADEAWLVLVGDVEHVRGEVGLDRDAFDLHQARAGAGEQCAGNRTGELVSLDGDAHQGLVFAGAVVDGFRDLDAVLRRGASSAETDGMLMALATAPVSRKSLICSATCRATFSCASIVAAPRWGVQTTFSSVNSGEEMAGSVSNTSRAAPATWPDLIASARAASSSRPPRAQLMMRTPSRVCTRASRERMLRVASVSGVCRVMMSARDSRSSSSTFSTPSVTARFSARNGS